MLPLYNLEVDKDEPITPKEKSEREKNRVCVKTLFPHSYLSLKSPPKHCDIIDNDSVANVNIGWHCLGYSQDNIGASLQVSHKDK